MDPRHFDDLARVVAASTSRRDLLKTVTGGALATVAAALGFERAGAAAKRSVGNSCKLNSDCASNRCVQEGRTRKICHCASAGDCPAGDLCRSAICLPSGYCGTSVTVVCTAPNECYVPGTCQPATGQCSAAAYRGDGASCSTGVCSNGACCAPLLSTCASDGECCSGACQNNLCCKGVGAACNDDPDCCGTLFCVYGICGCVSESLGATCSGKCGSQINDCGETVDCGTCCTLASGRVSNGPPTQEIITIQDTTHGGIASIVVTQSDNADTPVPPFTVGTTDPVTVTATKIDQSQNSDVAIEITTVGGYSESCSYAF